MRSNRNLLYARLDDETFAYISVWDPFRGSFVLAYVTSAIIHAQLCVRTHVCHEWRIYGTLGVVYVVSFIRWYPDGCAWAVLVVV